MANALSAERIAELLTPYGPAPGPAVLDQLSIYLDLLIKWNGRTNLSAIRDAEQIVQRHFGESLFAARRVPPCRTLLDLGSGAGFPGLPVALVRPEIAVTLAESQNKKATFLREVIRTLDIDVEVFAGRVESMPQGRLFDVVTLRAVDRPALALALARERLLAGGAVVHLTTGAVPGQDLSFPMPNSLDGVVYVTQFRDGSPI